MKYLKTYNELNEVWTSILLNTTVIKFVTSALIKYTKRMNIHYILKGKDIDIVKAEELTNQLIILDGDLLQARQDIAIKKDISEQDKKRLKSKLLKLDSNFYSCRRSDAEAYGKLVSLYYENYKKANTFINRKCRFI